VPGNKTGLPLSKALAISAQTEDREANLAEQSTCQEKKIDLATDKQEQITLCHEQISD
jgi:Cu/Ag efflux protein CusF